MSTVLNSTTINNVQATNGSSQGYYTYYLEIIQNSIVNNTVNITVNFKVCANKSTDTYNGNSAGYYDYRDVDAAFGITFTNSSTSNVTASEKTANAKGGSLTDFTNGYKSVLSRTTNPTGTNGTFYTLATWTGDVVGTGNLGIDASVTYGFTSSDWVPRETTITCSATVSLVPTVYGYDGTAWRKAKAIYAYDGTQWRQAKEFWGDDGTQWRKAK